MTVARASVKQRGATAPQAVAEALALTYLDTMETTKRKNSHKILAKPLYTANDTLL